MSGSAGRERHDVVLRLLDHQICGPDGTLLGNVDDLELQAREGEWLVTGLMVGPAALSQRMPGRLGDWAYAVWRRLHPAEAPAAVVVPMEHVVRLDSAVHVDEPAARALALTLGLELWLREHVIGRLPGATEAGSDEPNEPHHNQGDGRRRRGAERNRDDRPPAPARAPAEGARGLSSVLGRPVRDPDGRQLGRVSELRCTGRPRDQRQTPLRVESVVHSPHLTASELGYSIDRDQGPALVRRVVRTWQRHDRVVDVAELEGLDDADGDLRLADPARSRHPHDDQPGG